MRRYQKNDWWDLMTVIEQELERDQSYKTFFNIADELKWRLVESISEGGNFKIKKKMKEIKTLFETTHGHPQAVSESDLREIKALFGFVLGEE